MDELHKSISMLQRTVEKAIKVDILYIKSGSMVEKESKYNILHRNDTICDTIDLSYHYSNKVKYFI